MARSVYHQMLHRGASPGESTAIVEGAAADIREARQNNDKARVSLLEWSQSEPAGDLQCMMVCTQIHVLMIQLVLFVDSDVWF